MPNKKFPKGIEVVGSAIIENPKEALKMDLADSYKETVEEFIKYKNKS